MLWMFGLINKNKYKAITHVDGTCRIQTVTEEQNPHYYRLIQEFEKITGVPILFNTSFNLAGDPLVETIEDALETMLKSEMKYMYVPELGYLLEKK
jgi:carbamoyltransferase